MDKGNGEETVLSAMNEWYSGKIINYNAFARRYPMNGELMKQNGKVEAMFKWCNAENITHTPTIFLNGHELLKEYSIADLEDFL